MGARTTMRRSAIVFVLLAFAAGAAFGYVLGSGGATPVVVPGPRAQAPSEPTPIALPEIPKLSPESPAISAAIASIPIVEPPRGTGSIHGKVVTEAGKPLAGVVVYAKLRTPPAAPRRPGGTRTLEDKIRDLVVREEYWRRSRRETVSAADGTFEFTELPDLEHQVQGSLDGYSIRWANADDLEGGAEVELKAKPVGTIRLSRRAKSSWSRGSRNSKAGKLRLRVTIRVNSKRRWRK